MKRIRKILLAVVGILGTILLVGAYIVVNPIFFAKYKKRDIPVNKKRLYTDVETLTTASPARNSENTSVLTECSNYIADQFKTAGGAVEFQTYTADKKEYRNVIASFGPSKGERIVVGAHYDVYGDQPGADDNASAVAGLLELGRMLGQLKPKLKYGVDLVAFTLEEPPYFRSRDMGSAVHAKSLKDKDIAVKCMICLEMIGYFTDAPDSQQYPVGLLKLFYPSRGNYITVVGNMKSRSLTGDIKASMIRAADIDVRSINAPVSIPGIDFSDHASYWKQGFKAVMVTDTAFYRNNNYHTRKDTIDTLDFDKMSEVVKGVYWAVVEL
ncbi:MAG: M28 family peptidase [bacterium]|nr:M28 family peptidase [bacterium]